MSRQSAIRSLLCLPYVLMIVALLLPSIVSATQPAVGHWAVQVSTAPHLPQDVWFAGMGNNLVTWRGGGSICLNQLAQGLPNGEQATFLVDVIEGGLVGVDGTPELPDGVGTYTFPGVELPSFDYTVISGGTFYVILDGYVVQSKLPELFPAGNTFPLMFMWDHEPGRTDRHMVLWIDFGEGFEPFLNEGVMMANVKFHEPAH